MSYKKQKHMIWLEICLFLVMSIFLSGLNFGKHTSVSITHNENINLAIYLENEQTTSIPSKDSGYYFDREKSSCTNDAYINWDSVSWSPVIKNARNYPVRCELHFTTTYNEGILNGTDPILKDELIPVEIEDDGTVKKADLTKPWYSYAEQKWANAVITQNSYDALTNSGDVHGATKNDGYVSFDGVDDYIDLGLENYDFGNKITLALNFTVNENKHQEILSNLETAGANIYFFDSKIYFSVYVEELQKYVFVQGPEMNIGTKYTLAATYDGNLMKLYVNGELLVQDNVTGTIKVSILPFLIGANPGLTDNSHSSFSNTDIYQVAIYNRALSEDEIKESTSNEIKVVDDTGLLRYLDFTNKTNYETNEIIPESVIESFFVWIPKYRYQLWDLGTYDSLTEIDTSKVHEIPIIFGDYNTSDSVEGECTTPMESGATGNCKVGDYMTHPAFLSIPSKGFWVGKFETGYEGATSMKEAEVNKRDASKIIVKPNVYSWRGIQVANAFYSSYDYKRNLDSHMMKNTEWGAVAYLQHSKYGSQTSVRLNNNSDYITGYQANGEPTCGYTGSNEECNRHCNDGSCNTVYPNSVLASTTNNISGIFDMSGGAWEYVMGIMLDQNEKPMSGRNSLYNSGFNGTFGCPTCDSDTSGLMSLTSGYEWPEKKYYDTYAYSISIQQYIRRILGDATGEMGPFNTAQYSSLSRNISSWYANYSFFIHSNSPWFHRGASYIDGLYTGLFAVTNMYGLANDDVSFRVVLTP